MRETRIAQASLFDNYSKHEFGIQLEALSDVLDEQAEILTLIEKDLVATSVKRVGRNGLSVESVFRCLLLKQQLRISYEQLSFHLSDSMTYRTFARLPVGVSPSRSGLQSTIRSIRPETLEQVYDLLSTRWVAQGSMKLDKIRIDSTVVKSHITPPSDSQLLNDSVRVLSRYLAKSQSQTGVKIRFTDKRKASKSLAFSIFNAKNKGKEALYPKLLILARVVLKQVDRALDAVRIKSDERESALKWIQDVEHFRALMLRVMDQTQRRVIDKGVVEHQLVIVASDESAP